MEGEQDLTATGNGVEGETVAEGLNLAGSEELDNGQGEEQLQDDELQSQERELSPREAIVEGIADRRREEVAEQQSFLEEDDTDFDDPAAGEAADTTTIIVNGDPIEVKTEDVMAQGVRTLQKESAADRRLEDANAKSVEIDVRERELTERENKFNQGLSTDEQIDADAERFSEAIVEDENAAGEMFKQVLKDNRDLKAATAELIQDGRETRQERVTRQRKEHSDMVSHYHTEFKDIAADTHLTTIFNTEATRVKQANPGLGYQEVFEQAGNLVRERYIANPENEPTGTKARKRNMQRQPKKAGGRVNLSRPVQKPKTTSQVIVDMRKSRGQEV